MKKEIKNTKETINYTIKTMKTIGKYCKQRNVKRTEQNRVINKIRAYQKSRS